MISTWNTLKILASFFTIGFIFFGLFSVAISDGSGWGVALFGFLSTILLWISIHWSVKILLTLGLFDWLIAEYRSLSVFGWTMIVLAGSIFLYQYFEARKRLKKEKKRILEEKRRRYRIELNERKMNIQSILAETEKLISNYKLEEAKKLLTEAKSAFNEKHYKKSEKLAIMAKEKAEKDFENLQKAKGLIKYKGRWGTPEQVEKWKEIDIGLSSNFANLTPFEFQEFIAKLFEKMGYLTTISRKVADYGIDIVAEKNKDRIVVQVKKYSEGNNVGAQEVQQTLGAMWKVKANKSIIVTTSDFTVQAEEQAKEAPIELWNKKILHQVVRRYFIESQ